MKKSRLLLVLAFFCSNVATRANDIELMTETGKTISRSEYINQWKDVAILHMQQYGIPASITLAQGILESAHGNSMLAQKGNNHFGIKCHDWKGETIYANDDRPNECFRKYSKAEDSFEDHAQFLKTRSRYAFLFDYRSNDYTNWAHGLKKAGYATSPTYATALIKVIEDNKLYEFDQLYEYELKPLVPVATITKPVAVAHPVRVHNNGIKYVIVQNSDTYYKIAKEFDMSLWQLYKYNDVSKEDILKAGDVLYLQGKKNKNKKAQPHIVKKGETTRDISQQYGVKVKKLEKRNDLERGEQPKPGEKIILKGRKS